MKMFAAALTALLVTAVQAQERAQPERIQEPPLLYRVEVVVFSRTTPDAGAEEAWPMPRGLAYPERWRILDAEPEAEPAPVEAATDTGTEDTPTAPASSPQSDATEQGAETPGAAQAETGQSETGQDGTAEPEATDSRVWVSLPQEQWRLADSAARLHRTPGLTVLLHQAWLQPALPAAKAPALVVEGGEAFGDHRELEGYLTLIKERYLHLEAELWLSRFRFGSGMDATLFSPLPTPPHRRATAGGIMEEWFGTQGASGFESSYVPSQIFVLRQSRRLETDQLYYLDHPLMGILVEVQPIESEEEPADPDADGPQP